MESIKFFATSPQSVAESHLASRLKREDDDEGGNDRNDVGQFRLSLKDFVGILPATIEKSRKLVEEGTATYGFQNDPIAQLFRNVDFSKEAWESYALFAEDRNYTRNLIATDDETFTLLLLCWNPGRESPIHDHPCDGCYMKVCQGLVRECRYEYAKDASESESLTPSMAFDDDLTSPSSSSSRRLKCIQDETFKEGQLAYIADSLGFHKVGNPSSTIPAVTIHLYVPPIKRCKIWMTEDSLPSDCQSSHYSEYGRILQP